MDLIERQKAIDALTALEEPAPTARHLIAIYDCEDAIESLPSAQPEQRWIPCSERLPEENGRYLVTRGFCDSLWNRVYIVNYSDLMGLCKEKIWWSGNVGKLDFERHDNVLAWMPLPEPYKTESEDKG